MEGPVRRFAAMPLRRLTGRPTRLAAVGLVLVAGLLAGCAVAGELRLLGLDGETVAPFSAGDASLRVFLFTRTDCPVSNRYAPEVRRIHEAFAARGVAFWLVYPDPDSSAAEIREHLESYGYAIPALRDPRHELVRRAEATITPEAAVFNASGERVYLGRIDDRYVDFGKARPRPTRHDLVDALEALLAGRPVAEARTTAVGCYIVDLAP